MKRFAAFVAIGSAFATVEEFLTVLVIRRDLPAYLFTLIVLFPAFLSLVYISSRWIDRVVRHEPARDLVHLLGFGSLGLLMEWTLMGLSPWSNPSAHPLLMLGFQVGMFAFWSTVATAPRAFLDGREHGRRARRRILRFFLPYLAMVYVVAALVPVTWRFVALIPPTILGYSVVAGILLAWALPGAAREAGRSAERPQLSSDETSANML